MTRTDCQQRKYQQLYNRNYTATGIQQQIYNDKAIHYRHLNRHRGMKDF